MNKHHIKFVLNILNDEKNLVESLSTIIPSLSNISDSGIDEASLTKLHNRIPVLLQSKSIGIRWCGVCICKVVLERRNGGWESLKTHGAYWISQLLKLLEREADETLIERIVSTISAIFQLTYGKPSLTRDLTTPSIPTFLKHAFSILERPRLSENLVKCILYNLLQCLKDHPTTFRPYEGRLRSFTSQRLNGFSTDPQIVRLSAECFASLHMCAPQNTSAEQWSFRFLSIIGECHACLTFLFQAVVEEKSILPIPNGMDMSLFSSDYCSQVPLAVRRLQALMQTLEMLLALPTRDAVKVPIGQLIQLFQRSLVVNSKSGIRASTPQSSQVALVSILPQLHAMTYNLASFCTETLNGHMVPHTYEMQQLAIQDITHDHEECRVAALMFLSATIRSTGLAGDTDDHKKFIEVLGNCLRTLHTLLPPTTTFSSSTPNGNTQGQGKKRKHTSANEGSDEISHSGAFHRGPTLMLLKANCALVESTLHHTYGIMTERIRHRIDFTVVTLLNKGAKKLSEKTVIYLLRLLRCSLMTSDSSAIFCAGLDTLNKYCVHDDPCVRSKALEVSQELEILIHPRVPATRRRPKIEDPEEEEVSDDTPRSDDVTSGSHALIPEELPQEVDKELEVPEDPVPVLDLAAAFPAREPQVSGDVQHGGRNSGAGETSNVTAIEEVEQAAKRTAIGGSRVGTLPPGNYDDSSDSGDEMMEIPDFELKQFDSESDEDAE